MFRQVVLFEASLFLVAVVLAWIFAIPLRHHGAWNGEGLVIGLTSSLPMISMFFWLLQSKWQPSVRIREMMDTTILPIFKGFSTLQLGILACVAGISEEVLFRAVIQGGLQPLVGTAWAVFFSALVFGVCHALTGFYFVMATLMGIYLSLIWLATDQLLSPIITHAAYDFFVLVWYLKYRGSVPTIDTKPPDS